jgi:chromate transport protein ChrA
VHNLRPGRISENYYLQIGQEVGWLGLGLFVAIVIMVGHSLWRLRHELLARTLFVSLIGISVVALVQHVWVDDTLALLWWGFAGTALAVKPSHPQK